MTDWFEGQVEAYRRRRARYEKLAAFLESAVREATMRLAPLAIVQSRTKSVSSFAEKALRKQSLYSDPVSQFTDLCGIRVITRSHDELVPVVKWLTSTYNIDWANSDDTLERLGATEFGYRSLHYIVSVPPEPAGGVAVPKSILGLRAEIQLRTMLEHAWADVTHDLAYKGDFSIPRQWQREIATTAAGLEEIDSAFSRIERGLKLYATSYGKHFESEELAEESRILETVLANEPGNPELAWRAGKLAMIAGDWARAVSVMESHVDARRPTTAYQPLLRDLGVSLCKRDEPRRTTPAFRRGQRFLETAADEPYNDPDAWAALGGVWRGVDAEKALDCYRRAFELDPADYYALANYLECELEARQDPALLRVLAPTIERAISRCHLHIEVGVNLPWALFSLGELQLFRQSPYAAAHAYARGVASSPSRWMLEVAAESARRLADLQLQLPGSRWAESVLQLGMAARFGGQQDQGRLERSATGAGAGLRGPVLILAGATANRGESSLDPYRQVLRAALSDFSGTIVSGGTRSGVASMVGEVGRLYPKMIRTIGYVPRQIPAGVRLDDRYSELRRTEGSEFSLAEPIQYWTDILASGVPPHQVALLALGGGTITHAEIELAKAFGARTAAIAPPDQSVAVAATPPEGGGSSAPALPLDVETIRAFLVAEDPLPPSMRQALGRAVHESYVSSHVEWETVREAFRESSVQQADHIPRKLARVGCEMRQATADPAVFEFTESEIETLAEIEHGRWNAERASKGWRYGPERDPDRLMTPFLVPWSELHEEIRESDRRAIRDIPRLLASVGYEILRRADH